MNYNKENRLIAHFMGYEDYRETSIVIKNASPKFVLCYDAYWMELMPVIDKIEAMHESTGVYCQTTLTSHSFTINYNSGNVINESHPKTIINRLRSEDESKIENAFLAIVQFIEWYNYYVSHKFTKS